jgi:hypothetical protein
MTSFSQLAKESIVVAILTVIFGLFSSFLISRTFLVPKIGNWNKHHAMEIALALTGILVHLFCEFTGLNAYYISLKT